jgi:CotH kinase protein/Fn3 associated
MLLLPSLLLACAPASADRVEHPSGSDHDSGLEASEQVDTSEAESVGAAGPRFSPEHGLVDAAFDLDIDVGYSGAELRYTLDASDPRDLKNPAVQLYDGPLRIDSTTVVRAVAFRDGAQLGEVASRTWVFPSQVLDQVRPADWPSTWFEYSGTGEWTTADYEMDPEIVDADRDAVEAALRALPTISLVIAQDDLFGEGGIYDRPDGTGTDWERPAAFELLPTTDDAGFSVEAGVRIHGGASRDPGSTPKKSFRLLFKQEYGPGELDHPLYPDSDIDHFDTLVLRAGYNHSWTHWDPEQRPRALYTRDAFASDGQLALGHRAVHDRAVHLYISGVYWGLYHLTERPDARAMAAWYGGDSADWDVINTGEAVDGNDEAWVQVIETASTGDTATLREQVDTANLIDYMLLNFYLGNDDWPSNNWYAGRQRPDGVWRFFEWDAEHTLKELDTDMTGVADLNTPAQLWAVLLFDPDFKAEATARVAEVSAADGALGVDAALERFEARIAEVGPAVVAESARWGDYRRDVYCYASAPCPLYTVDEHWDVERQRVVDDYLPLRTAVVQAQLAARGL